eukprot:m.110122 g.110122  ORF g.110122 m.110122 type:complete len:285 (+) comp22705_c0_seq5:280-1134(+)
MLAEGFSILFATVFQGFVVAEFRESEDSTCRNCTDDSNTKTDKDVEQGYITAGIAVAVITTIAGFYSFWGIRETVRKPAKQAEISFFKGLRFVLKFKAYVLLMLMFLFGFMAVQTNQANYLLYVKYSLDREDDFQELIITLLLVSMLAMTIWVPVINRFGKKAAYAGGVMLMTPALFINYVMPKRAPVIYLHLSAAFTGIALSSMYLLPWSCLPDCVDESEYKTGMRKEALFYSFFVFFQKLAVVPFYFPLLFLPFLLFVLFQHASHFLPGSQYCFIDTGAFRS